MNVQAALQRAIEFHQTGRLREAEALYRQILDVQPRHADALHLLGLIALQSGHPEAAVEQIQQAIASRPSDNFYCNLGNALKALGRRGEAIASYRQALVLNPQLPEALCNLGHTLVDEGQGEEAAACCRRAIALRPGFAAAHCNLGRALAQLGHLGPAIDSLIDALKLADHPEFRAAFVDTVRTAHFRSPHAGARALVTRALEEQWADPAELLTPAVSLVECSPAVQQAVAKPAAPASAGLLATLAADPLLRTLLQTDTINSIALERLLTRVRRQMLDDALADRAAVLLELQAALASQCFINEYVYAYSDDERQQLVQLHARLAECRARGATPNPQWLTTCACYARLADLPGADAWAALSWPDALDTLFTQQVREPAIERDLRATVPCLTPIQDPVSQQVREQYEEHPYPRWTRAPSVAAPVEIGALLRHQFPGAPFVPSTPTGPLDVLVAGCGTGQHPIRVAREFRDTRVLAVDLSLASLAYAKRKTAEAGLTRIEYAQADILQLGTLQRRFDLIESSGVLHHMADPVAGWQVLVNLLKPGGLMAIGLYSELGRRDVVTARERLAASGLPSTADQIRLARQRLMADDLAPQFEQFLASRDFYATSACRDLLFHVQEHRFTLPQLKAVLARLRLNFIGFALDPATRAAYARQFPQDPAQTDLDRWHAFETSRPQTFARMYQFWVQKPAS